MEKIVKQYISWFYHIEHEYTKLTKLVLHFSDFSTIFYAFYKLCCSVLIGNSDISADRKFRPRVGSSDPHRKF